MCFYMLVILHTVDPLKNPWTLRLDDIPWILWMLSSDGYIRG